MCAENFTCRDTEALSIHDCKPPGLSRRSCELHAGRRLFARNAGWHIRQEYVVRASPDADDRIAAKTEGEGVSRHLDFYRLRPCLFLKFDAGYGRLHRGARDLCPVPEGATVERVAHVYRLVYAVGDVDLDDVLALSRENDQRAPLVSA